VRAVTTINFRERGLATPCFDLRKHSNREPRGAERVVTRANDLLALTFPSSPDVISV
jgi:hypothetical protein